MRIGVDVRCFTEGRQSGIEEYTKAVLTVLFEIDRKNEYILFFNAWGGSLPDFSWATAHPNVTLRAFRIPNKILNFSLWYFGYPKLDRMVGGVDVLFLPNISFAAVSRSCRLVVTAHDLSFEAYPETFSIRRRLWHSFVNPKKLLKRADRLIAVSESTGSDLRRRYGVPPSRITVVQNGVDERFHPIDRNDPKLLRIKEKYGLPYRFVLYLGAFEPRKNIVGIVRAWDAFVSVHPDYERAALVLAGVSGWNERAIRREISASSASERILLPGFIDEGDKPALYNLATCFVYPSFFEGFGLPVLEAMACGTPVIASDVTSLPEVVDDAGILVDPYRPDEIYRAIESVLADATLREDLSREGIRRAAKFSWVRSAKGTLKAIRGDSGIVRNPQMEYSERVNSIIDGASRGQ